MIESYRENGYLLIRNFLSDNEIGELRTILNEFHRLWQQENAEFYQQQAVNSAYLTRNEFLNSEQRERLFQFIGSEKVMAVVKALLPKQPCFLNTQLFFNPVNKKQTNYWHRDPQYHLSIEQQQAALASFDVMHLRLPLLDEPGIELVPGTHKRWDSTEELQVRLEQDGHKNNQSLAQGKVIKLFAGDLLVFSANMIHRGLYGMDRLALDILFCPPEPSVIEFVREDCLPNNDILAEIEDNSAFVNTIKLKALN
ncbi:phytanoyl-CoA dioxygenase family protein [Colwellia psychrerythraea]|uniref:Phytanoyl-CoA dioxygenase n=1 Tax=Colwellia psychrerythraea TaxID=28229 RepID=A0A099KXP9_COLPS|nr:phytanoyl-CoA dioxygenase family protein [Colwellia psychrerythraea]KGJ94960.1 Phytanoyl-CoA dioxygenase [Colwellia psychrerythraea]